MLSLVLALALTQQQAPVEPAPAPPVETPEAARLDPFAPHHDPHFEPPPERERTKPAPTIWPRAMLSGAGGVAGAGAALAISLAFTGANPSFDVNFATAALGSLLVTGVAFSIHQAMGGRGEITLALLLSIAAMAGSAALSSRLDGTVPRTPILTAAIGAVPAAALAVFALEGTTPKPRRGPQIAFGPLGLSGTF